MKEIAKNDKGITLIVLITTIILMLILTSVATYTGINIYKRAQVTKFVAQMQIIQTKVDEQKEELEALGEENVSYIDILNKALENGEIKSTEGFKYFSKDKLSNLGLEDMNGEILINFETREVVSTIGVEYEEKTYYTQYLLPSHQTVITYEDTANRDLSFDLDISVEGLNATVKVSNISITNGTLSYKEEENTYWKNITNYTETGEGKTYDILISKSGTYEFKLTDNVTGKDSNNEGTVPEENKIEIKLANKPNTNSNLDPYNYALSSENWAYIVVLAENIENTYVWIPRFAYKTDDNNQNIIKYIKGNSNIATDNSVIDSSWTINSKFNTDNGIWVKVNQKNQENIDMIDLLNNEDISILTEI